MANGLPSRDDDPRDAVPLIFIKCSKNRLLTDKFCGKFEIPTEGDWPQVSVKFRENLPNETYKYFRALRKNGQRPPEPRWRPAGRGAANFR